MSFPIYIAAWSIIPSSPLVSKYTKMIIDLDSRQNIYDFHHQIDYHKYFFNITKKVSNLNFYLKRQIIYQRNKIIMMLCSQIFAVCTFVLLISGINGGWEYLKSNFSLNMPVIQIKKLKARWGACFSNQNKVCFNLVLVHLEKELIDYVIVHELCHFIQPNHSKLFYQEVHKRLPDYKEREKKLKEIGI